MSDDTPMTEAERGYSKGYAAGQRRIAANMTREERQAARDEFRRAVFLAVIPHIGDEWKQGEKHISLDVAGKVEIAWDFADEAMKKARLPS